ncbi:Crp/Fnr family transcriptional regulator [Chitinophaga arvensicola]|uniref:cAMP-binding domain of CRP or a regulatory subunit of cAMP-dependent protein kinases n=1 Tax=Chitinophaga arvensicola TaxID=29529 RepID=A0A1I0Q4B2_9BACT|nr:Crp/Fnr family transcriptional regulator [Chitinophaga arvensicola]SEW21735.1 cAMP-binding domain of CRP or a regulatory subunit of cAMP-dependent protein kinases [Chitinophaga arvensicola]
MNTSPQHFLQSLAHIAPLSEAAMALFTSKAILQMVKKDDYLLREDQHCQYIWFVETGACRTFHDHNNKEVNTGFYFENTFFTHLYSLRNNVPADYNIQVMETGCLWKWHKDDLFHLYQQSPEITAFGRLWLEHLFIMQETRTHWLQRNTPEERYQSILKDQPELLQRVSLTQLSSYLGISRETISRIRRRLK